jgi:hypothetical protein
MKGMKMKFSFAIRLLAKPRNDTAEYDVHTLKVLEWASIHREKLLENWKLAIEKKEINKIEPLK